MSPSTRLSFGGLAAAALLLSGCGSGNQAGNLLPESGQAASGTTLTTESSSQALAACFATTWNATTVFQAGGQATENGVNYTAWYYTKGANPASNNGAKTTGDPWGSNGACGSGSSTPAPTAAPTATPKATAAPTASPKSTPAPTASPKSTPAPTASPKATAPPSSGSLNPNVPPSSNFNLSHWQLQLPTGSKGSPTTISSSQLSSGYTSANFFTDPSSGAMDFYTPEPPPNCVTTANSLHCRSELMEVNSGGDWKSTGTNVLSATLAVTQVSGTTVIGQIHPTESDTVKPLCELYYSSSGQIQLGIEATSAGGNEVNHTVGQVSVGQKFTYVLTFNNNVLGISINGASPSTFAVGSTFNGFTYYFKAGDYGQGSAADADSFYALSIQHA